MKEYYIELITELITRCQDIDLLELISKILINEETNSPTPAAPCQAMEVPQEMRWAA